jgi:hypothetical protein
LHRVNVNREGGERVVANPKVTINVKKVRREGGTEYWILVGAWHVRAGMDIADSPQNVRRFKSGEQFQTKDELVEEMRRRARTHLKEMMGRPVPDDQVMWDIREE